MSMHRALRLRPMTPRIVWLVGAVVMLLSAVVPARAADSGTVLRDGDTVVFFGDSITVAHTFQRAVELYVLTRDPQKRVRFINAGVGGHTASDGLARIDDDVIAHKPNVVVLNFGMNDSAYPEGTDGADFEKNMGRILDTLKAAGVRVVVWADTTPYDPGPRGRSSGKANVRRDRIDALVKHTASEAAARGLISVSWNEALADAVGRWAKAKRWERLIPDRVHPSPTLHAIMATQLIRALGYAPSPTVVAASLKDGHVSGEHVDDVTWDGQSTLSLAVKDIPPPLLLIGASKDAVDLGAADALALRTITLKVAGLEPKRRYRVAVAGVTVATETGAALAKGTDLMARSQTPMWQPAPAGTTMTAAATPLPDFSACDNAIGAFEDDFACLWGRSYQKDQLRIAMRADKTRALPDYVPGRYEAFMRFQQSWVDDAENAIFAEARRRMGAPHIITLTPEP